MNKKILNFYKFINLLYKQKVDIEINVKKKASIIDTVTKNNKNKEWIRGDTIIKKWNERYIKYSLNLNEEKIIASNIRIIILRLIWWLILIIISLDECFRWLRITIKNIRIK